MRKPKYEILTIHKRSYIKDTISSKMQLRIIEIVGKALNARDAGIPKSSIKGEVYHTLNQYVAK